ncbi:MAG TPA: hypothetical protein VE954_33905, partial [Oligoflexus sp.]|uniref:hypothetical protein n=1 Tax=Oligoflexus sp. TaxID=1971216 RepID=UPI002D403904
MTRFLRILLVTAWLGETSFGAEPAVRVAIMQVGDKLDGGKPPNLGFMKSWCAQAQMKCTIMPLPPQRAFVELQANRVQFVMSMDHQIPETHPQKIAKVDSANIVVVASKPATDCKSLQSMNLASFRSVFYARKLQQQCPGLQLTWTNTYGQGMRMYRNNRVDGMIGVEINFMRSPEAPAQVIDSDVISQVGVEDVWLFGNDKTWSSELASRLTTALSKLTPLSQQAAPIKPLHPKPGAMDGDSWPSGVQRFPGRSGTRALAEAYSAFFPISPGKTSLPDSC